MDLIPNQELIKLSGKTAIVTGGAMGIGNAIAYRLCEAGANVVIADVSDETEKSAEQLTQKGWLCKGFKTDVSKEEDIKNLITQTLSSFTTIDILVNNAGIFPSISIANMTLADFEKVINVNLKSVFLTTKLVSGQMIKQGKGGKIINITSIDALHPSSIGLAHYDASKHGVWGFTKNSALELAPHKIWVNAIAPGGIATPGVQKMQGATPTQTSVDMKKVMEEFLKRICMNRMGEPDEIGKVALFLASNMSSYMTGSQIIVDGGTLLI